MEHAYWGPEFTNEEIEESLKAFQDIRYYRSDDICAETADLLAQGKIIGWFQGRSRWGRAPWVTAASWPIRPAPK